MQGDGKYPWRWGHSFITRTSFYQYPGGMKRSQDYPNTYPGMEFSSLLVLLGGKPEFWASLLSTVTGKIISGPELLKAAERVINMERMINAKLGFDRKNNTLLKRLLTEPSPNSRGARTGC